MENSSKILENWQNRLQFTIVAVMFFPNFLSYLYPPERIKDFTDTSLAWSTVIGFFIFIYLVIELMRFKNYSIYRKWIARLVSYLLLLETASFLPLLFLGSVTGATNPFVINLYKFLVVVSIYSLMYIPVIIILLLIINFFAGERKIGGI